MFDKLLNAVGKKVVITFNDDTVERGRLFHNMDGCRIIENEFDLVSPTGMHLVFDYNSARNIIVY